MTSAEGAAAGPLTGTVLDELVRGAREDLRDRMSRTDRADLARRAEQAPAPRDAHAAIAGDGRTMGLIAEVKRASPSKGSLADIPDPAELAGAYAEAGASAISVLTERRRFRGTLEDLDAVRSRVTAPVLRKDFVVDEDQVLEARAHGADLVLLIVAALDDVLLTDLHQAITALGMQALVETHDEAELERALALEAPLLGVNARDLRTLDVDLERAARLISRIPDDRLAIGESAVAGVADVERYAAAGADAVLVGEALVVHDEPREAVRAFRSVARRGRTPSPQSPRGER